MASAIFYTLNSAKETTAVMAGHSRSKNGVASWSAVVTLDALRCAANAMGTFDIVFVQEKETAPDLEFGERFVWRASSVKVTVDFAADEAVQSYRIDNVTPCACGE
jgi:hypothetical protein